MQFIIPLVFILVVANLSLCDGKKIITDNGIECSDKNRKAQMRSAIWNYYSPDLQLDEIEIDVSKEGDVKSIWTKIN